MILEDQKRINDYDYKKMLDDFELEARHNKILRGIRDKWRSISAIHNEKVEEMKVKTEKMYKKKDKEFKKKLLQKEEVIKRQLEMRKRLLSEEKKRREEITKKKVDDVQKNLRDFKNIEEQKRLIVEKEIFGKSKIILFNNISIVMKIEKRHNQNKLKLHKNIVKKNFYERNNYMASLDKYLTKKNEESIIKKQKAFQKYQSFVSINLLITN